MAGLIAVDLLTLPEVAERLDVPITRVHQHLRDGDVIAIRDDHNVRRIPADLIDEGVIVKGLKAVITLLRDFRYTDQDIVDWLFRPDDSLPGTPAGALRANRGTEIKRRAQAAGF